MAEATSAKVEAAEIPEPGTCFQTTIRPFFSPIVPGVPPGVGLIVAAGDSVAAGVGVLVAGAADWVGGIVGPAVGGAPDAGVTSEGDGLGDGCVGTLKQPVSSNATSTQASALRGFIVAR